MSFARDHAKSTARYLIGGFATIIIITIAAQAIRYVAAQQVNRSVDETVDNALESIRLLGRIGVEVERWRLLIERHLFDETTDRATFERQLTEMKESLAADGEAYEPLADFPGERVAWERVKRDLGRIEGAATALLAGTQVKSDHEAKDIAARLDPLFADIEGDVDSVIELNRHTANDARQSIKQRQDRAMLSSVIFTAIAVAITLMIAAVVIPLVMRRQERIERHSLELENRNRELDAFAGRVAHDLRGPLTAISLSSSRLSERLPQEEGVTAILKRGVRRMEVLIEDLLALSRIDAQVPGVARTVDVAHAVESDLGPKVNEVGGSLVIEVEPAEVRCSAGLLQQVLWNLGENAVKFRRPEVPLTIEISGYAGNTAYQFTVRDNGCGMAPVDARRAFEPFFRGSQTNSAPGTGLGLSIVKRVVDATGGSMSLESKLGEGSTFRFTIPLAPGVALLARKG